MVSGNVIFYLRVMALSNFLELGVGILCSEDSRLDSPGIFDQIVSLQVSFMPLVKQGHLSYFINNAKTIRVEWVDNAVKLVHVQ
jgi:hypothetical protein